jgi:predicted HTH domain antitoxin
MPQRSLTLNLPEALARELAAANQDLLVEALERGLREMKIDRALNLYSQGGISFGAAAERAGVSLSDLARFAYSRGVHPPFSSETLSEELGETA